MHCLCGILGGTLGVVSIDWSVDLDASSAVYGVDFRADGATLMFNPGENRKCNNSISQWRNYVFFLFYTHCYISIIFIIFFIQIIDLTHFKMSQFFILILFPLILDWFCVCNSLELNSWHSSLQK